MKVKVIGEFGYDQALFGLGLSYNLTTGKDFEGNWPKEKLAKIAETLAHKNGGHNKFLESIMLWIEVNAPRYWWQEADTYRLTTKQSASTMHSITKNLLTQNNFEDRIPKNWLNLLNRYSHESQWEAVKTCLPESFLQTRLWRMDYKTLRNIISQRKEHKLKVWQKFIKGVLAQVEHPRLLKESS